MKKKKLVSKILAIILMLCLTISVCPNFSVFADEVESKEQLTEKSELLHSEVDEYKFNFEGDLSLDELKTAKLDPDETPEIVSAESIAENKHVNRLWEQEEDLNTIVFQNKDGTKTAYHYSDAVKYKDENGKIKDKKNKLSEADNGDYTNAENDINAYFPKKVHKNKGVELRFGEYVIEMAPNINGNSGACRQTGHDKDGKESEYVEYPDVFGEGISVKYTPTFVGYKEDIILKEYSGINRFEFKLTTNGLSLVQATTGNYYLAEPLTGEYVTSLGNIVIYDNGGNESEGYNHYYEVTPLIEDEQYLVTVVVDERYLESENTEYPVCVDPTLTVMPQGCVEDAVLYSNNSETAFSGLIKVGYASSYGIGRGLYDFPLLNFTNDFIKMYANQIVSAELNLYATIHGSQYDDAKTLSLYEYNSEWSPYTVKWKNTSPNNYGTLVSSKSVTSGWTEFNILPVINKFKTNSDYTVNFKGLLLKANSETYTTWKKFVSSSGDAKNRPYITITYNDSPTACSQVASGINYYLKNDNGNYLDVYNNEPTSNTKLLTYSFNGNTNQAFKITYISNGEYEIAPNHTDGKVLSVNSSKQVIIEDDSNKSRQRWYIFYRNGKYHIVNKQYNTGVMAPTDVTNYVSINNEYYYCCWTLERIECDAENYTNGDEHADLHILKTVINRNSFPRYECLACGTTFRSPEEQDFDILSEADLITVHALHRASIIKEMEGKDSQVDACIRAIDKIRSKYVGFYEYSYQNGQYKSPYSYAYNANSIDINIDIATIQYDEVTIVGNAMLWNVNQLLPYPLNTITESLKNVMVSGKDYSYSELFNLAVNLYIDGFENETMNYIRYSNVYLYYALTAFDYANAVFNTIQQNTVNIGDVSVQIDLYGNTVNDTIIGYYNLSNDKVNILDERVINETRNVTGVATNRFNQSYSVDEDENPLCFDRNGVLFDN